MTCNASQLDHPPRWRPRFSIRTLVTLVTLLCGGLGCWVVTKTHGVPAVESRLRTAPAGADGREVSAGRGQSHHAPIALLPFVVTVSYYRTSGDADDLSEPDPTYRECHLWFFGFVARLPWTHDADPWRIR